MTTDIAQIGIERRGDLFGVFATNDKGAKQEIVISSGEVLHLSRLLPSFVRKIASSMLPVGPGRSVSAAVPVKEIQIVDDIHQTEVLLNIKDIAGGDFDYSISPNHARRLGLALIERANLIDQENAKKKGH